ncbi:unnamed protein product [Mytilus edulis]|uniref:Kazal-like domain-containing protein n=1 Tax=Mytilus edulis TaxID=6550 RepID=A0A8S3Q328_MYTED|nr:unnamed protein product [Mytilus edulis]
MDVQTKFHYKIINKKRKQDVRENMDQQTKSHLRKKDKTRKLNERENMVEQTKLHHKIINKKRKQEVRENMNGQTKSHIRKKDKTRKLNELINMDEQAKLFHRKKDKSKKLNERENMDENDLNKRRLLDKRHNASQRASRTADTDAAIHTFQQSIKTGPTFICTVCHRLMYKECVTMYNENNYKACDEDLLKKCNTGKTNYNGECYICNTCSWNLKRNKLPAQAVANCLQLDPIPEQLKDLSNLECTFISTRLAFMKMLALPQDKQKAIHGCVVNVPVNPEETCSVLPHLPSSSSCITVKLKRKIEYRGHVKQQSVRAWKVLQALYYLKSFTLSLNAQPNSQAVHVLPSLTESRDESDDDNPKDDDTDNDELEDRSKLTGLPYDTCLQPKDMSANKDFLLNITPGEERNQLACQIKDQEEMRKLAQTDLSYHFLQNCHRHSATCRKHGTKCRFSFPRPPLEETRVFLPPIEETNKSNQTIYSAILTSVHEKLDELPQDSDIALQSLLGELKIPQQLYVKSFAVDKDKTWSACSSDEA